MECSHLFLYYLTPTLEEFYVEWIMKKYWPIDEFRASFIEIASKHEENLNLMETFILYFLKSNVQFTMKSLLCRILMFEALDIPYGNTVSQLDSTKISLLKETMNFLIDNGELFGTNGLLTRWERLNTV
jgi:hypothetical protein